MKIRMNSKWSLLIVVILMVLFAFNSCMSQPSEMIISDKNCVLKKTYTVFETPTKLSRNRNRASVQIYFSNTFTFENGILKVENGNVAIIDVVLIDDVGKTYTTKYYGMEGYAYAAKFPHLDKNIKIVFVKISSTADVFCKRIAWYCFDPI